MKYDRLDQARFPYNPSDGFGRRVLAAARTEARPKRPALWPELLDGVGWVAAMWTGAFLLRQLLS